MKKILLITILLFAILTPLTPALAGPGDPPVTTVTLVNPLGGSAEKPEGQTDIRALLGNIIAGAMGIIGSVVLAVFIYGGFLWLTSAGNTEQVTKGTNTMLWAAIGLFLIFGAYAILGLVLKAIGAKGGGGPAPTAPVVTDVPAVETEKGSCQLNVGTLETVCGLFDGNLDECTGSDMEEEDVKLCEWDFTNNQCNANVVEMSALCDSKTKETCEGGNVTGDCEWVKE